MTRRDLDAAPLISVIVPVHNGERHLADALRSVRLQTYPHVELLVVDDGSTDASVEVARQACGDRCRVLQQTLGGPAAARNRGIAVADGAWLAFLDADDRWPAEKLERQAAVLAGDPGVAMVFGHYVSTDAEGSVLPGVDGQPQPGYSLGTLLARRDAFSCVGPLATTWRVGEFIDWFARAEEAGLRHMMLPEVLLLRRVHGTNLTGTGRDSRVDYARIVAAAARRRGHLRGEGA